MPIKANQKINRDRHPFLQNKKTENFISLNSVGAVPLIQSDSEQLKIGDWMETFSCEAIPIIGFFYLIYLAVRRNSQDDELDIKKVYARARLLQRFLIFMILCISIFVIFKLSLPLVDEFLNYLELL